MAFRRSPVRSRSGPPNSLLIGGQRNRTFSCSQISSKNGVRIRCTIAAGGSAAPNQTGRATPSRTTQPPSKTCSTISELTVRGRPTLLGHGDVRLRTDAPHAMPTPASPATAPLRTCGRTTPGDSLLPGRGDHVVGVLRGRESEAQSTGGRDFRHSRLSCSFSRHAV
jgi:hypothetical protein